MPKQFPCEKKSQCGALDNMDINFLPREPFKLECVQCKSSVLIDPKKILSTEYANINFEKKDNANSSLAAASNANSKLIKDDFQKIELKQQKKIVPILSILVGIVIIASLSLLMVKVVFKTSLNKYKKLSKQQIGQESVYTNEEKIVLDIATDDYDNLKNKASEVLKKTVVQSQVKRSKPVQYGKRYSNSKQYSDYVKRYSKLPKNIREVYELFPINQISDTRELIIQHMNTTPEHVYISNIILSELYSYLSYVENKPKLNNFALENLKKLNRNYPETPEWKRSMSLALYVAKDYKLSFEYIDSIKNVFQNDPIVQTLNSVLVYQLKNQNQGKNLLKRAHLISPKHYLLNHFYSDLLFNEKNYSEASNIYQKMIFSKTVHPEILQKAIYSHKENKQWDSLIKIYKTYFNNSKNIELNLDYAKALSRSGKNQLAIEKLSTIKLDKLNKEQRFNILNELAQAHYNNKGFLQANKVFADALQLQPSSLIALKYMGNSFFRLGRYYDAINYYQKAYALEPSDALRKNIALSYFESKQYQKSIEVFSALLDNKPENYIFIFYLARSYSKLNENEKALSYAQNALALAKDNTQIKLFIEELKSKSFKKEAGTKKTSPKPNN